MTEWLIPLLSLGSKWLIYSGCASLMGGWFVLLLGFQHEKLLAFIKFYMLIGAIIGVLAVGINFYARVGSFAESGWQGMLDADYQMMLWDSAIGDSVVLRLLGFVLVLALILLFKRAGCGECKEWPVWGLALFAVPVVLLAATFVLRGHTVEQSAVIRFLLGVHVLIALLWMGALLPLWHACKVMRVTTLQVLMQRFGLFALGLVAVLVICGVIIVLQLLASPLELFTTAYGRVLLVKIVLVGVILGLAARHKLRLVPRLTEATTALTLRHSIMLEFIVGLSVLLVTVWLTTLVGPESLHS